MSDFEQINDELLVIDAQQGSVEALTELVKRWHDRLWRFAWRLTDDEQAAWDVVQDSWVVISRRVAQLEDPVAFPSWAYRITSNKAHDWIRRRRSARRAEEAYGEHRGTVTEDPNRSPPPYANLREALADLPGRERAILSFRYEDNFTTAEIAEILRIPPGTVKSRLHHARQRLRRFLEEDHHERP